MKEEQQAPVALQPADVLNTAPPASGGKPSALRAMASRLNIEPEKLLGTLKETVFAKSTDSELAALVIVSNEYKLNPFTREIFAFPKKGGGIVPVVSIDGWLSIINGHPQMNGMTVELEVEPGAKNPVSCTVSIFRKDRQFPVVVTEYFDECQRNTEPWRNMPKRMLRHKGIIQAGRVAFSLGGIHDEDEARDIVNGNPAANVTRPAVEATARLETVPEPEMGEVSVTDQLARMQAQHPDVFLAIVNDVSPGAASDSYSWRKLTPEVQSAILDRAKELQGEPVEADAPPSPPATSPEAPDTTAPEPVETETKF